MRKTLLRVLAAITAIGLFACSAVIQHSRGEVKDTRSPSFLYLQMLSTEFSQGSCSGSAVGPHTILTATHCVKNLMVLKVNGQVVHVAKVVSDTSDHSFVIVDGVSFETWARFGKLDHFGQSIYIVGNPGGFHSLFRRGIYSGKDEPSGTNAPADLFDINGFPGDSGSGIYDEDGHLVGLVSYVQSVSAYGGQIHFQMTGSPLWTFTEAQVCEGIYAGKAPQGSTCLKDAGL